MGARPPNADSALKGTLQGLIAATAFCLSASAVIGTATRLSAPDLSPGVPRPPRFHYASYCDDTALYADAYRASRTGESTGQGGDALRGEGDGTICGGTISHHLFARNLIAGYFSRLAGLSHPGTIILVGPNHRGRGRAPVAMSALPWRTPFGFVEPDTALLGAIAESGLAQIEEEPFENEHSIAALVPFIRVSFPGTRIVPLIFKKGAARRNCVNLAEVLSRHMDSTIVLGSLDFSHYRTSREAEGEDRASLRVLRALATDRVDDAFVDSRPALLTLMQTCRGAGAGRVLVVEHTNSGILAHKPDAPCTSYINTFICR